MGRENTKTVLIVIPKSQFSEEELGPVRQVLEEAGVRTRVLSKTGREAVGMNKTRFQPDGMLVDWDKQAGVAGKYDGVLVIGGKGASKSLWDDPILPQILTDHYRAGRVIGAIGLSVAVLARASLLTGEASGPEDPRVEAELQAAGVGLAHGAVTRNDRILTAKGPEAAVDFAVGVLQVLREVESDSQGMEFGSPPNEEEIP